MRTCCSCHCAACVGVGTAEERKAIGGCSRTTEDDRFGGCALGGHVGGTGDRAVRAIRGDEVDDRQRILDEIRKVGPTRVGREVGKVGGVVELRARVVERRNARLATAGEVEHRQVERQAQQVGAQVVDDELVHLIAHVAAQAADDVGIGCREVDAAGHVSLRVEEECEQGLLVQVAVDGGQVVLETIDGARQHRVPEAVDRVRELGDDRGVDFREAVEDEGVDQRLDAPRELFEHHVLVLHFRAEACRLEQAFAVPLECGDLRWRIDRKKTRHVDAQPLVDEGEIGRRQDRRLVHVDEPVVLGVEDAVDGGQRDVLVAAPVAGDEMRVEHFIVVGVCQTVVRHTGERIRDLIQFTRVLDAVLIRIDEPRRRVMCDVVQEGVAGALRVRRNQRAGGRALNNAAASGDDLGEARVGAGADGNEFAVLIGDQQRHVVNIVIDQANAQHRQRLRLDFGPVADGAVQRTAGSAAVDQLAGRARERSGPGVFAQEHLVRWVRRVGLILINPRRRGVLVLRNGRQRPRTVRVDHGGRRARQRHEPKGRVREFIAGAGDAVRPEGDQRVVRLQRDEYRAVRTLRDQVQAVIEELTEEGHPGIEAGRQANVGRSVRDGLEVGAGHLEVDPHVDYATRSDRVHAGVVCSELAERQRVVEIRIDRRRVGDRHVDDQVGDDARVRIDNVAGHAVVRIRDAGKPGAFVELVAQHRSGQAREQRVRGSERVFAGEQVVEGSIDRAQTDRHLRRNCGGRTRRVHDGLQQWRARRMRLGDLDLLEDEFEVCLVDVETGSHVFAPWRLLQAAHDRWSVSAPDRTP